LVLLRLLRLISKKDWAKIYQMVILQMDFHLIEMQLMLGCPYIPILIIQIMRHNSHFLQFMLAKIYIALYLRKPFTKPNA
uniref:Uncharacterized protein n=1 Tax=Acrobeloides nanus TaxID=290746 RepID=A0A914EG82_9BILA